KGSNQSESPLSVRKARKPATRIASGDRHSRACSAQRVPLGCPPDSACIPEACGEFSSIVHSFSFCPCSGNRKQKGRNGTSSPPAAATGFSYARTCPTLDRARQTSPTCRDAMSPSKTQRPKTLQNNPTNTKKRLPLPLLMRACHPVAFRVSVGAFRAERT